MATQPTKGKGTQPDDSNATSETIAFIRGLHTKYNNAKLKLSQFQASLSNLKIQQKNIGEEYTRIRTDEKNAQSHLEQAESAKKSVLTVLQFFQTRKESTENLVKYSHDAAQAMFLSLYQLKEKGLERVEEIKALVIGKDNTPQELGTQDNLHWTQIFSRKVIEADAQGVAAFNAGAKAVQEAFNTYVSNQEIHARTVNYYNRFMKLEAELQSIISFKHNELSLINKKYIILDGKNKVIESQVSDLTEKVEVQSFIVAQALDEYNAAQQGAEYKYVPPTAPAA
ncbi:MAG: hypothetical protein ACRBG0_26925 [Lewinella sp.]|uniref:hypothetical protein n=1 Tax=Lewinella sp. TaxID=2004506 RepID=UPI003D6AE0CE